MRSYFLLVFTMAIIYFCRSQTLNNSNYAPKHKKITLQQQQSKGQSRLLQNSNFTNLNFSQVTGTSNQSTQTFQIDFTVIKFLKMYDSRSSYCRYLCQADSLLKFASVYTCYAQYGCFSLVVEGFGILLMIFLYGILPIFMIVTGIWNFKCYVRQIGILTGVVLLSVVYQKMSNQFQQNIQTDYQISHQDISSQGNTSSHKDQQS